MNRTMLVLLGGLLASPVLAGEVQVIDGDTIEIAGTTYRLYGIDAPEAGQKCEKPGKGAWPCGKRATEALVDLIANGEVTCDNRGSDDFGRVLAVCEAEGTELNSAMVEAGMAWAFRRYSDLYTEQEDQARKSGTGVWQADTQTPWDYRAERWAVAEQDAPEGCPIKGNIARDGERIYHTPWSPWYSRTKLSPEKGERWFCNEREALDAGWRAPMWGN